MSRGFPSPELKSKNPNPKNIVLVRVTPREIIEANSEGVLELMIITGRKQKNPIIHEIEAVALMIFLELLSFKNRLVFGNRGFIN